MIDLATGKVMFQFQPGSIRGNVRGLRNSLCVECFNSSLVLLEDGRNGPGKGGEG